MTHFHRCPDKDTVKAFVYEDLKNIGIKVPKLEKLHKAGRGSMVQNSAGGCVFGVPLSLISCVEDEDLGYIPKFMVHIHSYLLSHLGKEGLFRKTGSVSRQKDLAAHIENHQGEHIDGAQVYDITSVVKQFFREMPDPLIPRVLQEAFVKAVQLSSQDSKIYALSSLSLLMPLDHMSLFRYLLEILSQVSQHSGENKMTAYNLAVCITPNLFHTKQNAKQVQQQTEAIEICIENVNHIGVVPPSLTERVVMLKSLEANEMIGHNTSRDSNTPKTSNSDSFRKKRRSGSLQGLSSISSGFVGSIRRSVEKLRIRTRRSASVPSNLNVMNDSGDYGFADQMPPTDNDGENSGCTTPQIVRKRPLTSDSQSTSTAFSMSKRRAILDNGSLLSTPFNKDGQATQTSDPYAVSANTPQEDRIKADGRKRSRSVLKSPFSRRKRSMSAGPSLSPSRLRTSSRTKKLIRRLSGGSGKAQEMIGQRLAYSVSDGAGGVRQRLPSSPAALSVSSSASQDSAGLSNEELMKSLKTCHSSVPVDSSLNSRSLDTSPKPLISRDVSVRDHQRPNRPVRRRARSTDSRLLQRGYPNHASSGLVPVTVERDNSNPSLYSDLSTTDVQAKTAVADPDRAEPTQTEGSTAEPTRNCASPDLPSHSDKRLKQQSDTTLCIDKPPLHRLPPKSATSCELGSRRPPIAPKSTSKRPLPGGHVSRRPNRDHDTRQSDHQEEPANPGSPVLTQHSGSSSSHRVKTSNIPAISSTTTSSSSVIFNQTDSSVITVIENLCHQTARADSSFVKRDSGVSLTNSSGTTTSKSSVVSTDSGISDSSPNQPPYNHRSSTVSLDLPKQTAESSKSRPNPFKAVAEPSNSRPEFNPTTESTVQLAEPDKSGAEPIKSAEQRDVIGRKSRQSINRNVYCDEIDGGFYAKMAEKHLGQKLIVRGASLNKPTHDSVVDLKSACHVNEVRKSFDKPESADNIVSRPPRHQPVRIPTVFAKNDPRAMRYKMAADAVKRRSLQKSSEDSPPIETVSSPSRNRTPVISTGSPRRSQSSKVSKAKTMSPRKQRSRVSASLRDHGSAGLSLRQCNSPPQRNNSTLSIRSQRLLRSPQLPISTNLVKGIGNMAVQTPPRPLTPPENLNSCENSQAGVREQSANVQAIVTPRIKPAMLPLENVRPSHARILGASANPSPIHKQSLRSHAISDKPISNSENLGS